MVSAKALVHHDKKTQKLLFIDKREGPVVVQIFGSDPEAMAEGARMVEEMGTCAAIDINMGCPTPKITSNGDGSALMKDLPKAKKVIESVVKAVKIPVTVKIRKGWDAMSVNAVELALIACGCGAAAVCIHGRTRDQFYCGLSDWGIIAEIKRHVTVPVIGNGDIKTPGDAKRMLDDTGCDAVMVGRGALGNPFLFAQMESFLRSGKQLPDMPVMERLDTAKTHVRLMIESKGEKSALLEARKHLTWYLKGIPNGAKLKNIAGKVSTYNDLLNFIDIAGQMSPDRPAGEGGA
jgi:nifR3 family TIM-barrel protein